MDSQVNSDSQVKVDSQVKPIFKSTPTLKSSVTFKLKLTLKSKPIFNSIPSLKSMLAPRSSRLKLGLNLKPKSRSTLIFNPNLKGGISLSMDPSPLHFGRILKVQKFKGELHSQKEKTFKIRTISLK